MKYFHDQVEKALEASIPGAAAHADAAGTRPKKRPLSQDFAAEWSNSRWRSHVTSSGVSGGVKGLLQSMLR